MSMLQSGNFLKNAVFWMLYPLNIRLTNVEESQDYHAVEDNLDTATPPTPNPFCKLFESCVNYFQLSLDQ